MMTPFDSKDFTQSLQNFFSCPSLRITKQKIITEGDGQRVSCLSLSNGEKRLLKELSTQTDQTQPDFFKCEIEGLKELKKAILSNQLQLIIPEVSGFFEGIKAGRNYSYLIMDYHPPSDTLPTIKDWQRLAQALAQLHLASGQRKLNRSNDESYGLKHSNYLGRAIQKNKWHSSWREFFKVNRIQYQLEWAKKKIHLFSSEKETNEFLDRIVAPLPEYPDPTLIHGDLWQGNVFFTTNQIPVMIDPAIYYGHREVDLAMSELFGGFHSAFYQTYYELIPAEKEIAIRKEIYNFYHLLNHFNLFGESYLASVKAIIQKYS